MRRSLGEERRGDLLLTLGVITRSVSRCHGQMVVEVGRLEC